MNVITVHNLTKVEAELFEWANENTNLWFSRLDASNGLGYAIHFTKLGAQVPSLAVNRLLEILVEKGLLEKRVIDCSTGEIAPIETKGGRGKPRVKFEYKVKREMKNA